MGKACECVFQDSRLQKYHECIFHGSSTTVPRCPQPARGASVAWGRPWLLLHNLSVSSAKSFTGPANGDPRKKSGTSGSPLKTGFSWFLHSIQHDSTNPKSGQFGWSHIRHILMGYHVPKFQSSRHLPAATREERQPPKKRHGINSDPSPS